MYSSLIEIGSLQLVRHEEDDFYVYAFGFWIERTARRSDEVLFTFGAAYMRPISNPLLVERIFPSFSEW